MKETGEKVADNSSSLSLSDIFEIAFLLTKGCRYQKMVTEKGRVRFIFEASNYKILQRFYGDEEKVNPRLFMHCIKDVKSLVYNSKLRRKRTDSC